MPSQTPFQKYDFTFSPIKRRQADLRRLKFLDLGDKNLVVALGGNIQEALDRAEALGGAIIRFEDGVHYPTSNLTVPVKTPIQFLGINMTTTVIDFGAQNYRFILAGTGIYTTGTVSITSGVTVTGSSTNWLSSGLVAGDEIFLDSRWYKIATIAGNTTIILAEGYGGSALAGATYRAGSIVRDIEFTELTIQNSTSSSGALDVDDARNVLIEDITFALNNKNGVVTNFSEWNSARTVSAAATGDGFTFTTGTFCTNSQFANVGNGGHGFVLNGLMSASFQFCAANGNTTDGFNITSCTNVDILAQANGNGGQGFESVSGNAYLKFDGCEALANVSDGIKLTASSDECVITRCRLKSSVGGYGINIADSTCDNNIIANNIILSNSSGQVNDSGTGTVIDNNVGV